MKAILKLSLIPLLLHALTSQAALTVTNIARGSAAWHSLFLKSDGSLWAMGRNDFGQLGDGTLNNTNRSEQIVASGVTAIAAGWGHSLFLKSGGSLWAMGRDFEGQLGDGTFSYSYPYGTNQPEQIVASGVTAIAAGSVHSLFLKSDGSLWAMGEGYDSQLGDGIGNATNRPEQIVASGVTAIAAGTYHSLFLKSDGSLWAMGDNFFGQLGDGTNSYSSVTNRPEQIVAGGVTAIAAGAAHSLFLKSDGSLWAMGDNYYGELGDGTGNDTNRPEQIVASGVTAIAAGGSHSLFLKSDSSLWAMGRGDFGQLGDGTLNDTNRPEQIVASGVTAIAAGSDHSLFIKSDGSLWGMGDDGFGQLGDGFNSSSLVPEQIIPLPQLVLAAPVFLTSSNFRVVTNIAAGSVYSFFIKSDGGLWAMGWNGSGQLGDGTFNTVITPKQIASNVTAVAPDRFYNMAVPVRSHALFLKSDGSLWAMGNNRAGVFGDGTFNNTNRPEQIVSNGVVAVAAGNGHSLFLKSDGSLWAMGANDVGELGDGTFSTNSPYGTNQPEQIVAGGVTAIAAGIAHSLFIKSDGSLWAMGLNRFGQLGDGTFNNTNRPEQIVSNGVVAIAAGDSHSLFLKSNGSLWAMGNNEYGQLGDGTFNNANRPKQIISNGVVAIAAGYGHSLFIKSDGSLWGMGNNYYGQLGDGTLNTTNKPEQIISSGVVAVTAGISHSLFLKTDGTLWGMGDNSDDQLGIDDSSSSLPKQLTAAIGNMQIQATCQIGGIYYLLASTNLAFPLSQWAPLRTNSVTVRRANNFSATFTNAIMSGSQQFYILQSQ